MKSSTFLLALAVASTTALAQPLPPGHPSTGAANAGQGASEAPLPQKGKVLSTMDAAGYTYLEVSQNKKAIWLAGPKMTVKKGDVVRFENGMEMKNFESKTLKRTFPSITFVNRVAVVNEKE